MFLPMSWMSPFTVAITIGVKCRAGGVGRHEELREEHGLRLEPAPDGLEGRHDGAVDHLDRRAPRGEFGARGLGCVRLQSAADGGDKRAAGFRGRRIRIRSRGSATLPSCRARRTRCGELGGVGDPVLA